jgi:death-on-curing protein
MAIEFLTLDEVLALHADQIERYGGRGGVRDLGLLSSAVATPQAAFGDTYLHHTLHEMAAAYLFHLVKNHPFIDGIKRVGLIAALAFLGVNRVEVVADPDALYRLVIGVADGSVTKAEVAVFLQANGRDT